ncbi:MAG: sulfite exporter TauE/SafE family protein [Chloroflexi bacterium]|nr:sulfite exporter TauE/SafE family protein [Chloroflexota bacterium]MCI0577357.1 sulfite exporter TauE/SafE family protein [Chloroflexota bacterium]MCI0647044.1 sulfite exporter TauE/SafE family protein [Chloroflexota bacterium]MCI0731067.1 sulfite exporter TauE/SafE family protein [Chloroflexota bacterium]
MPWLLVFAIVFLAVFTQSLTGFGLSLVSMPLLTALLGLPVAAPLMAVVGLVSELILLINYRRAFNWPVVWRPIVASLAGIPLGVLALSRVDSRWLHLALGLVVAGYALYALLNLRLPAVRQQGWAYGMGFLAGLLGGAYNISGPPMIIYGHCRSWPPAEFKSNLQGFFVLNSVVVVASHFLDRNFTQVIWQNSLVALPAAAGAIWLGLRLDRRIDPLLFRKIVLWLLLVLGLSLALGSLWVGE